MHYYQYPMYPTFSSMGSSKFQSKLVQLHVIFLHTQSHIYECIQHVLAYKSGGRLITGSQNLPPAITAVVS